MSEVQRYEMYCTQVGCSMERDAEGDYVLAEDHERETARLEARLREAVETLRDTHTAWLYEASQGDGIMEEHDAINHRATAVLTANPKAEEADRGHDL